MPRAARVLRTAPPGYSADFLMEGVFRMYQALYRKWRPKTFDEVVGQKHITDTLRVQVASGRLSHAYLFIGTRGTGKTSCAKILAKAVNCKNPHDGNPCNECESCLGIENGTIMDVIEMDAASNNGVDNIRTLREEAQFSPATSKKRVYIVDEVHMLSISAFNALLKILEEPPEHLMFILATTELHKVPATILSRCQRHSFKRITSRDIASHLSEVAEKERINLLPEAAALLGRLSDGSLRDALSLLEQCPADGGVATDSVLTAMGLAGTHRTAKLLEAIADGDTAQSLVRFRELWNDGKAPETLLDELLSLQRDVLMTMIAPKNGGELVSGGYDDMTLKFFAKRMSAESLISNIESIQAAVSRGGDGNSLRVSAELCIVGMCEPQLGDSLAQLRTRVERLEQLSGQPMSAGVRLPVLAMAESEPQMERELTQEARLSEPAEDDDVPWSIPETGEIGPTPQEDEPELESVVQEKAPDVPQEQTAAVHDDPGGDTDPGAWERIVGMLKGRVTVGDYVFVSDEKYVSGRLDGSALVLEVKDSFVMQSLKTDRLQKIIRDTAAQVLGREILIKLAEGSGSAPAGESTLDYFNQFSNVTIQNGEAKE